MGMDDGQNGKCFGIEISNRGLIGVTIDGGKVIGDVSSAPLDPMRSVLDQSVDFVNRIKPDGGGLRIGVAVPAIVSLDLRTVSYSSHIVELSGVDLAAVFADACGVTTRIENDANAAAYAEYRLGAGRGAMDMFYATLGAGVGGCFILGGQIWRGCSGFAGEFGYVPVDEEGRRLEDVASSANIIRRTRSRVHQDSTSSLGEIDESEITIEHIVEAAKAGDDFSIMMLDRTGTFVGSAIASVINLMNLDRVVVGGEVMDSGGLILDPIIEAARHYSYAPAFDSTHIVLGELGASAAATGAALLAA